MDYNISYVFLLGFSRGLYIKKKRDSIGITDDQTIRSWDSRRIPKKHDEHFEGFQNILVGILWDSVFLVISAALNL